MCALFFHFTFQVFAQPGNPTEETLSQQQFITGCAQYRESIIHEIEIVLSSFVQLSNSLASLSPVPEAHIQFRDLIVKASLPENDEMSMGPVYKVLRDLFEEDSLALSVYKDWLEENRFILMELGFLVSIGLLDEKSPYRLGDLKHLWEEFAFYELRSGMVIADIGAGNGFLSWILLNSGLPLTIIMTEVDQDFIALLETKMVAAQDVFPPQAISLMRGGNKTLGLEDRKVNCFIFREVFHHLKDPVTILKEARVHLHDDGYVILREATKDLVTEKAVRCNKATTYEKIIQAMAKAGYKLVDEAIIDESYLLRFKPVR